MVVPQRLPLGSNIRFAHLSLDGLASKRRQITHWKVSSLTWYPFLSHRDTNRGRANRAARDHCEEDKDDDGEPNSSLAGQGQRVQFVQM